MRRNHRQLGVRSVALVVIGALVSLGCATGDASDASNIVQTTSTTTSTTTEVPAAGTGTSVDGAEGISVGELQVGTCFDDPAFGGDAATVTETTRVQCFDPHDAEVYAVVRYTQGPDDPYPGEEAAQDYANDRCLDRFEDFVGIPYEQSQLDIASLWPTQASWDAGDREATCAVFHVENQKLRGTMDSAEL